MSDFRQILRKSKEIEKEHSPNNSMSISVEDKYRDILSMPYSEFCKQDIAIEIESSLLGENIFLISNERMKRTLSDKDIFYLPDEILMLRGLSGEELKKIHKVKKAFFGTIVDRKYINSRRM